MSVEIPIEIILDLIDAFDEFVIAFKENARDLIEIDNTKENKVLNTLDEPKICEYPFCANFIRAGETVIVNDGDKLPNNYCKEHRDKV